MNFPANKRYNSLVDYLNQQFGERFQKVTVDAGFSCPNRDGKLAHGGCTYCDNQAFNPSYNRPYKSLALQIQEGIDFHRNRYRKAKKFLVYFQPYSNTYAPVEHLKKLYEEALSFPDVAGLVIGTRPDCVDDEKLDLIRDIANRKFVLLEYGLETAHDETLERINRKHTFQQSVEAIEKAAQRNIHTGVHLIFGLPGENEEMMFETVDQISLLPVSSVKFHQLQIIKKTAMEKDYKNNPHDYPLFTLEEYFDFIVKVVERLNPAILIDRFAGEVPPRFLAFQQWTGIRYDQVLQRIIKKFEEEDSWQGKRFPVS